MSEYRLTAEQVDEMLERYDMTEPALQRKILVRILEKLVAAEAKVLVLEDQLRVVSQ